MPNAGRARNNFAGGMTTVMLSAALLIGGAACARPQVAGTAEIDAAAAKGDTATLAHFAEQECKGKSSEAEQTCYEDYFTKLARSDRVAVALGALANARASDHPEVQRDGHGYTHRHRHSRVASRRRCGRDLPQLQWSLPVGLLSRSDPGVSHAGRHGRFVRVRCSSANDVASAEKDRWLPLPDARARHRPRLRDGMELGIAQGT